MFKLTPITKEEKPSVAPTTDSFITETYEIENESDYQKDCAFVNTTIQNSPSENNIGKSITIECAGRYESYPSKAAGWAFVALNENLDIIYEDYGSEVAFNRETQVFHDYLAITKALDWVLTLPEDIEILIFTDSKYVIEPCPLNCECNDNVSIELKRELFELLSETGINSISLIPKETNRAAALAKRALEESRIFDIEFPFEVENSAEI